MRIPFQERAAQSDYIVILKIFSSSKTLNIVTGSRVPLGRRRWRVCGGWGGITGNQTCTQTPATAATLASHWSKREVIYSYQVHRSLLHMSRGCLHEQRMGGTEEPCVSKQLLFSWLFVNELVIWLHIYLQQNSLKYLYYWNGMSLFCNTKHYFGNEDLNKQL